MKIVLAQNSTTQRIVATISMENTLITKEWRKLPSDNWITGKGITLPNCSLVLLGNIVKCRDSDELEKLLKECNVLKEEIQVERHNTETYNRNQKNTYN